MEPGQSVNRTPPKKKKKKLSSNLIQYTEISSR